MAIRAILIGCRLGDSICIRMVERSVSANKVGDDGTLIRSMDSDDGIY
jgi:hypothetical protein